MLIRFLLTWFIFTLGPGIAFGARLTRKLNSLERWTIWLGLGSAITPVMIDVLGRLQLIRLFPFVTVFLFIAGVAIWRRSRVSKDEMPPLPRRDLTACLLIVSLAFVLGSVTFAHRLVEDSAGLRIYGDYDSFDLSHYASWASDATHTVPPRASFYSGHRLNAAYYPQLVLAMTHRFAGVPLLSMYFGYAWPTFLALGGLTAFALARLLAPAGTALLAVVLIIIGSDFSYLAAWFLPHQTIQWDYVLWPTNFLSPTMEVLHFNTWGPALPIFFTALYCHLQSVRTRTIGWLVASAFLTAVLFQFKPFAYIVTIAGLGCAFLFCGRDWDFRRRLFATLALTGAFTLPLLHDVLMLGPEDQRSRLSVDFFMLPQRMLLKVDLTDTFARFAGRLAPLAVLQRPVFLVLGTGMFLLVGLGIRWAGIPALWRALRGRMPSDQPGWRMLAWVAVAGVLLPFVLVTDPYVDTLQFYETGLYVLWIFAATGLAAFARTHRTAGVAAVAVAVIASTPSSFHYLARKWHDNERPAAGDLTPSELSVASFLRTQDPDTTVVLHDDPTAPSLLAVVSERRVVLGWGRAYYAVGSEARVSDVDRFFRSAAGDPSNAIDILHQYHVTHVVIRADRDRVHPEVIARLKPLMTFPDAALYAVPGE